MRGPSKNRVWWHRTTELHGATSYQCRSIRLATEKGPSGAEIDVMGARVSSTQCWRGLGNCRRGPARYAWESTLYDRSIRRIGKGHRNSLRRKQRGHGLCGRLWRTRRPGCCPEWGEYYGLLPGCSVPEGRTASQPVIYHPATA